MASCISEELNLSDHVGDCGEPVDALRMSLFSVECQTMEEEYDDDMTRNSSMDVHSEVSIVMGGGR
jgi:hypothetical protein